MWQTAYVPTDVTIVDSVQYAPNGASGTVRIYVVGHSGGNQQHTGNAQPERLPRNA